MHNTLMMCIIKSSKKSIIRFFHSIPLEDTEKFNFLIKLIIQFNNV